ncbi:MAG TPA: HD domain-containing phosphohydrolase, partial [Spirochaetota bacterium]|nr:HD domain-containing phosphohydrolase [Spirochaetota bacterium]HPQ52892.1 HD domain-containing phosphohydrolase [Spirochaetota bacterium]
TVMNLPDVYNLPPNSPVSFNTSIDRIHGYQSRTMLVVPMKNHIDEVIGVIQLINSKEDLQGSSKISGNEAFEIRLETHEDFNTKVVPFEERYNSLMEAVASQAAIAIENNRMIKQIQTQFEEFVKASVAAIESRDEATSGHSFRVAEICKHMARAVNNEKKGQFKDMQFSDVEIKELEYSALLHDFGKVYIDLAIFMKGKKLFPKDFENVMLKINYLYRIIELHFAEWEKDGMNRALDPENKSLTINDFEAERNKKLSSIKQIRDKIAELNEPTVTDRDPKEILADIMKIIDETCCQDMDGNAIEVIDAYERENLGIKRGSLNDEERKEIESHVIHTYNFVSKIPWPPEFKNIPEFALKHHEKLDGTGYPNNLKGKDQIPIQARMMAIADIYDALTASDRPYKKAIPPERAISILEEEATRNKIDPDLFEIFVRYKIYEKISKDDYRGME